MFIYCQEEIFVIKKLKEGRRFIVHPPIGILVLGMKWKVGNTITKSKYIHSN